MATMSPADNARRFVHRKSARRSSAAQVSDGVGGKVLGDAAGLVFAILRAPTVLRTQQGFRMACRDEPAVIVTDYFMPNGNAQYLLTRLRTTAATANIPVIVLSGQQLNDMTVQSLGREICGHPGATQILRKSQDTYALFETLKKFCGFEREPVNLV
ncbi:MAG TPA: hypothetical protein VN968_06710 [Bradyrhizobium sp.]|nr:hypothetical protein [Bradyrhizobium sp.]